MHCLSGILLVAFIGGVTAAAANNNNNNAQTRFNAGWGSGNVGWGQGTNFNFNNNWGQNGAGPNRPNGNWGNNGINWGSGFNVGNAGANWGNGVNWNFGNPNYGAQPPHTVFNNNNNNNGFGTSFTNNNNNGYGNSNSVSQNCNNGVCQTCINGRCYPGRYSNVMSTNNCPTAACASTGCKEMVWNTDNCPVCNCNGFSTREPCNDNTDCRSPNGKCTDYLCRYPAVQEGLPKVCVFAHQCGETDNCLGQKCQRDPTGRRHTNQSCVFNSQCPSGYYCENTSMTCWTGAAAYGKK